ncbi:MAG: serine hydrolase domain-containing protein [Longimicrobiales bacterium]|jgi:CubicO group peptidase (beta-lactamase class C family)
MTGPHALRVRRFVLAGLGILCACAPGDDAATSGLASVGSGVQRADSLVESWVGEGQIPGAVLLVSKNGETLHEKAYGWSRVEDFGTGQYPDAPPPGVTEVATPTAMMAGTVFDLASVTKVMATTMAIMLLVDQGLVEVAAPVVDYLPDFRGGGKETITVRHLLTHTSGLFQWQPTYYHATDRDEAYAYIRDLPLSWPVGEGRHYSDLGFMLLGRIVEEQSGERLDAYVERALFEPMGLLNTGFIASTRSGEPQFASTSHGNPFERRMVHEPDFGYAIEGDADRWDSWRQYTLSGEVNDGNAHHAFQGVAGHAGLFSTARELSTLLQMLIDGGEHDGQRLVERATVDRFLTQEVDGQALGWQLPDYAPAGTFAHTGFTGTFVAALPHSGLTVVLLTNRQNVGVDESTNYTDVGPLQRAVIEAVTSHH